MELLPISLNSMISFTTFDSVAPSGSNSFYLHSDTTAGSLALIVDLESLFWVLDLNPCFDFWVLDGEECEVRTQGPRPWTSRRFGPTLGSSGVVWQLESIHRQKIHIFLFNGFGVCCNCPQLTMNSWLKHQVGHCWYEIAGASKSDKRGKNRVNKSGSCNFTSTPQKRWLTPHVKWKSHSALAAALKE